MKKTLIAIAALAATGAFAQSSVTIGGSFESALVQFDQKGQKSVGIAHNLSSTSGIAFTGSTDLGGGLKASFKLGSDFNPATSHGATAASIGAVTTSTFGNAENKIGLTGNFGTLELGSMNNVGLEAHGIAMAGFGTAVGGGYGVTSTASPSGVRSDNTFRYDTPAFFGGVSASWVARKQNAMANGSTVAYNNAFGANSQSQISQVALRYNAGPLNAILVRASDDAYNIAPTAAAIAAATAAGYATASADKQVLNALAASYNMGALTLTGGWQGYKTTTSAGLAKRDTTAVTFGAKYVTGVNTFMAQYGRISGATQVAAAATTAQIAAGATAGLVGVGATSDAATTFGLGYEYALSKTTAVTARYERNSDNARLNAVNVISGGYTQVGANQDRSRMGVGLRVAF